jgi:hypothetical protein
VAEAVETYRRAERYIVITGEVFEDTGLADIDSVMEAVVAELDGGEKEKTKEKSAEDIRPDDPAPQDPG